MGYYLNRERLRVVERNDRGNVTYRKRYKKGDEVDVDHLEEGRLEAFLDSGVLVRSEDDLSEPESAGATSPTSPPFGAATTASTPGEEGPSDDATEQPEEDASSLVDEYDQMDYAELQQAAKSRDLSGGGSAEDLRARLRADDAE